MNDASVQPIPFGAGAAPGLDPLVPGAQPLLVNAMFAGGAIRSRPGLRTWSEFPTTPPVAAPVVEIFAIGDRLFWVTDDGSTRSVCALTGTGTATSLTTAPLQNVDGTAPPRVAVGRNVAIIAGGGAPQLVSNSNYCYRLGGSPPNASDVCFLSQYAVLAERGSSGLFFWSGVGEGAIDSWDTAFDFQEAEARPDSIVACRSTSRELYLFGEDTLQIFYPDPDDVFTPGPVCEEGCGAGKSIVMWNGMCAWLTDDRRLVMADGHSPLSQENYISSPGLDRALEQLSRADDCIGSRETIGPHDALVFRFPTDGRTFVVDLNNRLWGERRSFVRGQWAPYKANSYFYWPRRNVHLVGLSDGTIAELTMDATADISDPLRVALRTSVIRGKKRRHVDQIQLVFRRGNAESDQAALALSWRDNGGRWTRPIQRTLGTAGDSDPVVNIAPGGMPHHSREYELTFSADEELLLVEATETVFEGDF